MNPPLPPTNPPQGRPGPRRLWLAGGDDDRGGESFDALTDLFLGEVARPRRENPVVARDPSDTLVDLPRRNGAAPSTAAPVLRLIPADTDDAVDLIPASPPVDTPSVAPARDPVFIESLVIGNLPVFASAWVAQYVREIAAAAARPVAFLRVQAGFVTLELVGDLGASSAAAAANFPIGEFSSAIRAASELTSRWIIRVDQSDEVNVAARPGLNLVTLVTGADEAARVHAYAAIKELAPRMSDADTSEASVRIALMSASGEQADGVGRKLVDAVQQFLGRKVQYAASAQRIGASRPARLVFNGRLDQSTAAIIEQLETLLHRPSAGVGERPPQVELASAAPSAPASPHVASVPPPAREISPAVQIAPPVAGPASSPVEPIIAAPAVAIAPTPAPATETRVDDVALWSAAAVEPKPLSPPARAQAPSTLAPTSSAIETLASFIAGLDAVEIRCPYAPQIEFGLGADGRLHLLARSADPTEDDRVIGALMVASSWVEAHAPLLKPAVPGYLPSTGRSPLHLFTANPKASRRLCETDLRLHLLAPVSVAGQTGWYCAELN